MNGYESYLKYNYNKSVFREVSEKNLLKNFDGELQTFYHDVIGKELDLSVAGKVLGVKKALREVVYAYKKPTVESNASSILYDTSEKRCAYVMKHCACFGSAVARHFLRLLRSNPSVVETISHRRRLDLCCLGGGPGTEVVSIAKVIGTLLGDVHSSQKMELRVRVLDISGDWTTTVRSVLRALNETDVFFDRQLMEVTFLGLLETDLTDLDRWNDSVKEALREADVISMVYFVSAVNGSSVWRKCASMLKNIVDTAKPNCLLFFLDSAKDINYNVIRLAACQNRRNSQATLVYGPCMQEFHTLTTSSIRKYMDLYFHRFEAILCLTDCFITSAGWAKNSSITSHSQVQQSCPCPCCSDRISGRNWKKLVKSNTKKQQLFRQKLERLLLVELGMDFVIEDDDLKESKQDWPIMPDTLYASKSKRKRIFTFP